MEFNVKDIEWTYPVKNVKSFEYEGRPYVIAENDSDQIKERYVLIAFKSNDPKGEGKGNQSDDPTKLHIDARQIIDRYIAAEDNSKETKEDNQKLSVDLIKFGILLRDKEGQLQFTDLGTRTLQCLRMLHGRINAQKYKKPVTKKVARAPAKARLKRKHEKPIQGTRRRVIQTSRPAKALSLRVKGPILNHRLATFADPKQAFRLADLLKKNKIPSETRNAFSRHPDTGVKSSRCHVVIPFSKTAEAIPVLRGFRTSIKGA